MNIFVDCFLQALGIVAFLAVVTTASKAKEENAPDVLLPEADMVGAEQNWGRGGGGWGGRGRGGGWGGRGGGWGR